MYKNLKLLTVECLENENYHVYRKLFPGEQHFFKWKKKIARKLQESGNKQNKIKEN